MKISFFNSFGAIALTGLSMSLLPTNADAHDTRHPGLRSLPHGARCVNYRGERCWTAGGRYFRTGPLGVGFVEIETPVITAAVVQEDVVVTRPVVERRVVVKKTIVEEAPVVEEQVVVEKQVEEAPVVEEAATVEEPVLEEEDTVVDALPDGVQVVVIGGERCWMRDGVYYRHCDHGFKVCHPYGKHFPKHDLPKGKMEHRPVLNHGPVDHAPHGVVNHMDHTAHTAHSTANHKGDKSHN
jgi:hypothetical protein